MCVRLCCLLAVREHAGWGSVEHGLFCPKFNFIVTLKWLNCIYWIARLLWGGHPGRDDPGPRAALIMARMLPGLKRTRHFWLGKEKWPRASEIAAPLSPSSCRSGIFPSLCRTKKQNNSGPQNPYTHSFVFRKLCSLVGLPVPRGASNIAVRILVYRMPWNNCNYMGVFQGTAQRGFPENFFSQLSKPALQIAKPARQRAKPAQNSFKTDKIGIEQPKTGTNCFGIHGKRATDSDASHLTNPSARLTIPLPARDPSRGLGPNRKIWEWHEMSCLPGTG